MVGALRADIVLKTIIAQVEGSKPALLDSRAADFVVMNLRGYSSETRLALDWQIY